MIWMIALVGALAGHRARDWARQYARALEGGAAADIRTLLHALAAAKFRVALAWPDIMGALAVGGSSVVLFFLQGPPALGLVWVLAALYVLGWMDARTGLLPDALTLPLLGSGWAWGYSPGWEAVLVSLGLWFGLAILARGYRRLRGVEGLGAGDMKLLAALAAWLGLGSSLAILWGACVLGLTWHIGRALGRSTAPRSSYALGPCMAIAAWPVILCHPAVQSWFI